MLKFSQRDIFQASGISTNSGTINSVASKMKKKLSSGLRPGWSLQRFPGGENIRFLFTTTNLTELVLELLFFGIYMYILLVEDRTLTQECAPQKN